MGFDPRLPSEEPVRAPGCCSLSLGLPAQVRKRAEHGLLETDLIILAFLSGSEYCRREALLLKLLLIQTLIKSKGFFGARFFVFFSFFLLEQRTLEP